MRQERILNSSVDNFTTELCKDQLISINGGEDGDLAYIVGYSYVFASAHILSGGLLTYLYLYKKLSA